jgi:N-acetylmuramoyl-L-alanine amidase
VNFLAKLLLRRTRTLLIFIPVIILVMIFWHAQPLHSDNFVFYLPNASHVVPVQAIGHANYVPLLQVLNIVGKVQGLTAARDSLKVWVDDNEIEVRQDDKKVRIMKSNIKLSDPVRVDNGQWMVPLNFIEAALPQIIHQPVVYRLGSRRAFIGDVRPGSFSFRLDPIPNGARLTLQFSDKVNIRTASRNGKWVVYLGEKPVQPLEQKFNFQDPYLTNIQFDDQDGTPKLILTPSSDGLNFYSKLDDSGKAFMADLVKPAAVVAQQPPAAQTPATPGAAVPQPVAPGAPVPAAPSGPALPAVVLDAGHGAEDSGARGGNGVLEKDVVAQLVAHVRTNLLATKKYRIVLTRLGDVNPNLDQRDAAANAAHPEVFITFHAGNLGIRTPRIVVYTYQPSSKVLPSADERPPSLFIPWETAQVAQLTRSQQFAQMLQEKFAGISGVSVSPPSAAPMRVLRSVNAPAVAVELGSLTSDVDSSALTNPNLQEEISNAIVQALSDFKGRQSKP